MSGKLCKAAFVAQVLDDRLADQWTVTAKFQVTAAAIILR